MRRDNVFRQASAVLPLRAATRRWFVDLKLQPIVNDQIVEGQETNRLLVLDQRDPPDSMFTHQADRLFQAGIALALDHALRHELLQTGFFRIESTCQPLLPDRQ